jgi:hypothetical protein
VKPSMRKSGNDEIHIHGPGKVGKGGNSRKDELDNHQKAPIM